MKALFITTLVLLITGNVMSQSQNSTATKTQSPTQAGTDPGFEQYCLDHAVRVIRAPEGKAVNLKLSGEVSTPNVNKPTYHDYGVTLKENETQYFSITGSDQLLAVNSLYRLRIGYQAEQKN